MKTASEMTYIVSSGQWAVKLYSNQVTPGEAVNI